MNRDNGANWADRAARQATAERSGRQRFLASPFKLDDLSEFIERLRDPPPVVPVLRFDGVIGPRQWRGAVSLASHATALDAGLCDEARRGGRSHRRQFAGRLAGAVVAAVPPHTQLADEKRLPVLAFAEDVAASGGYCWRSLATMSMPRKARCSLDRRGQRRVRALPG